MPVWQPEPLHLPVYDPAKHDFYRERLPRGEQRDERLPGSNVIVIELA